MIDTNSLPTLFNTYRNRWADRDDRMTIMSAVADGSLMVTTAPDDEDMANNSPNLIQVGIEDTAESAALMPTIRVMPSGTTVPDKKVASKMEKIGTSYIDRAGGHLFLIRCLMDLVGFGFYAVTQSLDTETGLVRLDHRDAQGVYPEPGWRPGDSVRRCLFAREIFKTQLPMKYMEKLALAEKDMNSELAAQKTSIILVEWYDESEIVVAALYSKNLAFMTPTQGEFLPVVLERFTHGFDMCPVTLGQRISLDGEPRGQFDQVVGPMLAHARLMAMSIDYADQAVYSDIWVKDNVGPLPMGGGGVIQLGPNGAIGRVPPAVSSLSLFQELDRLTDAVHMGGRWPKARQGEIDQSQASSKFLESSVGVMNTAIRTLHEIMAKSLAMAIGQGFRLEQKYGKESATMAGVLRNQEFVEDYNPQKDIDLHARVLVEYGLGLGRDPSQSAVLHIQYNQAGMISLETVQESIDGVTDVERERRRLDVEKLQGMMFAKLMQGVEQGQMSDQVLYDIAKARNEGKDMMEVFKKYLIDPQAQAQSTGITSGLDGSLTQPGGPPAAPGASPIPGLTPPPAPPPPAPMTGLSVSAGPGRGNFVGSRTGG